MTTASGGKNLLRSASGASLIHSATGFGEISRKPKSICRHFPMEVFYEECEEWLRFHSADGDRRNPDAARFWARSGIHSERNCNGSYWRCHTGRDGYGHAYGIRQQI